MTKRTKEEADRWGHFAKHPTSARVYFFDLDTGREVALGGNRSGLPFYGVSCNGVFNMSRVRQTALWVEVADFATKTVRMVTADDFNGRVVAYLWHPETQHNEWRALVSKSKGWEGNEACRKGEVDNIHHPRIEKAVETAKRIRRRA